MAFCSITAVTLAGLLACSHAWVSPPLASRCTTSLAAAESNLETRPNGGNSLATLFEDPEVLTDIQESMPLDEDDPQRPIDENYMRIALQMAQER
jgi:hypothetical protein